MGGQCVSAALPARGPRPTSRQAAESEGSVVAASAVAGSGQWPGGSRSTSGRRGHCQCPGRSPAAAGHAAPSEEARAGCPSERSVRLARAGLARGPAQRGRQRRRRAVGPSSQQELHAPGAGREPDGCRAARPAAAGAAPAAAGAAAAAGRPARTLAPFVQHDTLAGGSGSGSAWGRRARPARRASARRRRRRRRPLDSPCLGRVGWRGPAASGGRRRRRRRRGGCPACGQPIHGVPSSGLGGGCRSGGGRTRVASPRQRATACDHGGHGAWGAVFQGCLPLGHADCQERRCSRCGRGAGGGRLVPRRPARRPGPRRPGGSAGARRRRRGPAPRLRGLRQPPAGGAGGVVWVPSRWQEPSRQPSRQQPGRISAGKAARRGVNSRGEHCSRAAWRWPSTSWPL